MILVSPLIFWRVDFVAGRMAYDDPRNTNKVDISRTKFFTKFVPLFPAIYGDANIFFIRRK